MGPSPEYLALFGSGSQIPTTVDEATQILINDIKTGGLNDDNNAPGQFYAAQQFGNDGQAYFDYIQNLQNNPSGNGFGPVPDQTPTPTTPVAPQTPPTPPTFDGPPGAPNASPFGNILDNFVPGQGQGNAPYQGFAFNSPQQPFFRPPGYQPFSSPFGQLGQNGFQQGAYGNGQAGAYGNGQAGYAESPGLQSPAVSFSNTPGRGGRQIYQSGAPQPTPNPYSRPVPQPFIQGSQFSRPVPQYGGGQTSNPFNKGNQFYPKPNYGALGGSQFPQTSSPAPYQPSAGKGGGYNTYQSTPWRR